MEYLMLALLLIAAVLISAVLDQFLRGVSLPLVQMALGVIMYFFVQFPSDVNINYELFLVMFIAPLLFDESRNVNNRILWENKSTILSMAIALVIASVIAIGFYVHFLVPSISLAAAFALGAALGPTDAVAVASLSKKIRLNSRQKASLLGEALLNDASGIVSFQFAIAAAVTGYFSLADASKTFLLEFVGGIVLGIMLGAIAFFIMRRVRRAGIESATFHVCFELFIPFFIYLAATQLHVSGILAVVAAGLYLAYIPQRIHSNSHSYMMFSSRLSMASESVWSLFSFVVNGIIFTDLGIVLCSTLAPARQENSASILWLISLILGITAIIIIVRFIWVLCCDLLSDNPETGERMRLNRRSARDALVTTLCGPKGAVSLSIASTLPFTLASGAAFPQRDLILFLVCGVIIVTLLLANFVVPLIAPKQIDTDEDELDPEVEIEILDNVLTSLKRKQTPENKVATGKVMRMYFRRLSAARKKNIPKRQLRYLRQEVLLEQRDYIKKAIDLGTVDTKLGEKYLNRVNSMLKRLAQKNKFFVPNSRNLPLASATSTIPKITHKSETTNSERESLLFKIAVERVAIDYLNTISLNEDDEQRSQAAKALLCEHEPLLSALKAQLRYVENELCMSGDPHSPTLVCTPADPFAPKSQVEETDPQDDDPPFLADVQAEALRLELDEIQHMYEAGRITSAIAREKREEIYLLQMGLTD